MDGLNQNNINIINTGRENNEDEKDIIYDDNRINID